MYAINPVNIPFYGLVETLTVQVNNFQMRHGQSYCVEAYVTLRGNSSKYFAENYTVPAEIVSAWVDDQVIIDFAITQLNAALGQELIVLAPTPQAEPIENTQEPTE